jgi:hypothetical protein
MKVLDLINKTSEKEEEEMSLLFCRLYLFNSTAPFRIKTPVLYTVAL